MNLRELAEICLEAYETHGDLRVMFIAGDTRTGNLYEAIEACVALLHSSGRKDKTVFMLTEVDSVIPTTPYFN